MSVIIMVAEQPETSARISQRVADRLGYELYGPAAVARATADRGLTEESLQRILDPRPRLLGMSAASRARQLAVLRESALARLLEDRVVCHGIAAHLYVHGVSHVLKVRVLEETARLNAEVAARERLSEDKASRLLARRSAARRRWSAEVFGVDESDPSLFDLSIKLAQIGEAQAVEIIASTVEDRAFQPMTYSQAVIHDLWVEAQARSRVVARFPSARVERRDGVLVVTTSATGREHDRHVAAIRELLSDLPEIGEFEVHASIDYVREAAESLR